MEVRSKIISVLKGIELQEEAITDLHQIKKEIKSSIFNPDEDIEIISKNLEDDRRNLKNLQRGYHHDMLSRLVKGGITDDEMASWWASRY